MFVVATCVEKISRDCDVGWEFESSSSRRVVLHFPRLSQHFYFLMVLISVFYLCDEWKFSLPVKKKYITVRLAVQNSLSTLKHLELGLGFHALIPSSQCSRSTVTDMCFNLRNSMRFWRMVLTFHALNRGFWDIYLCELECLILTKLGDQLVTHLLQRGSHLFLFLSTGGKFGRCS